MSMIARVTHARDQSLALRPINILGAISRVVNFFKNKKLQPRCCIADILNLVFVEFPNFAMQCYRARYF